VPVTKDDIDAVAINLLVDGNHTFQIYLTRGGLTKRLGSSDKADPSAILVQGRTDCYEPFMAAVPDALLQGESAEMEDGGRDGPRHDWRFEFQGGMNAIVYDIAYHAGSAGLPDEFADMVVQAERLTHSWYLAGVAEETGVPAPAPTSRPVAPPAPKAAAKQAAARRPGTAAKAPSATRASPASASTRPRSGALAPAPRERIALAVFLDLVALSIPYSFLRWVIVGGADGGGPPGLGLVLFAIVEFVLVMIVRRSPGFWLLGITIPHQGRPLFDPVAASRESGATLAVGTALCTLAAAGLTSWTLYHTAVPYFGLALPPAISVAVTVAGCLAAMLAGTLVLRADVRGVWVGGAISVLALAAAATGWGAWPGFVGAAEADLGAYRGRPPGAVFAAVADFMPWLIVAVSIVLLAGLFECWRRLGKGPVPAARALASRG